MEGVMENSAASIVSGVGNANVKSVQGTFARKETKYILTPGQYEQLMEDIGDNLEEEPFGSSAVSSLYYDTPTYWLINRSLEKPKYKEKLRIRSYGSYDAAAAVYAEQKVKFKGIVYKRRIQLSERAAYLLMAGGSYEEAVARHPLDAEHSTLSQSDGVKRQIAREIEACVQRYEGLRPALMVVVDRIPLHTVDGSNVRMTFDINARYRCDELTFASGLGGQPIFPDGSVVMEIKCQGAYPLWLVDELNRAKAYCQSCSKYGRAYQLACAQNVIRPPRTETAERPVTVPSPLFGGARRLAYTA